MLLLLQIDPARHWLAAEIARELRTDEVGTEKELALLRHHGLIRSDHMGSHVYAPVSDELHAAVLAAAQAYLTRRWRVVQAIYSK